MLKGRAGAWLRSGLLHQMLIYAGMALLIHAAGFAGEALPSGGAGGVAVKAVLEAPRLGVEIALYGLAVAAINLLPLALLLVSMRVAAGALQRAGVGELAGFTIAALGFWLAVLALNKLYFPHSSFAWLLPVDGAAWLGWTGGIAAAVFVGLGVLPACWRLARYLAGLLRRPALRAAAGAVLAVGLIQPLYSRWAPVQPVAAQQPDIIVIGLDSLSPTHLARHPGAMPVLEQLLRESAVFDNTLTPLARTFPAWTSILTAKYPVSSGARFNLTALESVETGVTLPKLLQARGYKTIYAQDERKFNNIDGTFGFDATVGPTTGAAEFVLTLFADHPVANLALLTPWAQQLFPYIALNRASLIHYDPDEFVAAVTQQLTTDADKPLFLAAHFCLAHYPYTWRTQGEQSDSGARLTLGQRHLAALATVDRQLEQLIQALKQAGRLEHAILVVLSDHGESLGDASTLWVSAQRYASPHDAYTVGQYSAFPTRRGASGHGTDVLDGAQQRTLLAFRAFGDGAEAFPAGTRTRIASLVDVMPTLLEALGEAAPDGIDGVNLFAERDHARVVLTETGLRLAALKSIDKISEKAILQESKDLYRVDPASTRLVLKTGRYASLVSGKDIALHTDEWMLALLRQETNPVFPRVALLVHKPTGAWTTGNDRKLIAQAPMARFRQVARDSYGEEIGDFAKTWAFSR